MGLTNPNTGKAVTPTAVVNPGGGSAAPTSADIAALVAAAGNGANLYANMKTYTNTSYLTQTSPQDVESLVNATMQALVGRNATPQEIQQYGAELLAAERSNQGNYSGLTAYGPTGKRSDVTGQQLTTGVDPQGFLSQLISGSADAQSYKAATGYFDGMTQVLQQMKSI
jgi:hypothetical protein